MNKRLLIYFGNQKNSQRLVLLFVIFIVQKTTAATFYINDNSIKGDIYTAAIGDDSNDGKSTYSPKLSIWATYQIAQDGDTIVIDTGNFKDLTSKGELLFTITKKITFVIAGISDTVFSKTPLPTSLKVNPTDIYIDKDKPIDRETYLQKLQSGSIKKSQ